MVQRRRRSFQRPFQSGTPATTTPARTSSVGPVRRPPQAPANRPRPYVAPAPARSNVVCDHCHKPGHVKKDCRLLLGQCLACGSTGHTVRDCPRRQEMAPDRRHQTTAARGPARPAPRGPPSVPASASAPRGKVFTLSAEEAATADGVVEGISCNSIYIQFDSVI